MINRQRLTIFFILLLTIHTTQVSAGDSFKGQGLYQQSCSNCHGTRGKGNIPGMPDFTKQQGLRKSDPGLLQRLRNGRGTCPPFAGIVADEDLLDIISYLRTMRR